MDRSGYLNEKTQSLFPPFHRLEIIEGRVKMNPLNVRCIRAGIINGSYIISRRFRGVNMMLVMNVVDTMYVSRYVGSSFDGQCCGGVVRAV